jgi:hypothetical protein
VRRPSVDDGSQRELTGNVVIDGRHIFSVPFWAPRSAVPSLHVVPDIGHLSAPCVMVVLAGIVHDREGAAGHEHNRAEDNQQGGLHVDDLWCCGPPQPIDSNERTMNAPEPSHHPKVPAHIGHSGRGGRLLPIMIGSPTAVAIIPAPVSAFAIISASCSTRTILVRASSPGILARHKPEEFMARRVTPSHVGLRFACAGSNCKRRLSLRWLPPVERVGGADMMSSTMLKRAVSVWSRWKR